jgi:2-oxoglutarate ferredoxin oxidoreductase subunit beta
MSTKAATAPYGNIDPAFDLCQLCIAAGATYVARGHVGNGVFLERLIKGGLQHKGFAVIEVMSNCHTQFGRRNQHPDPAEFVQDIASRGVTVANYEKLTPEERVDKYTIGVLHKVTDRPEYTEIYQNLQKKAMERARAAAKRVAEADTVKTKDEILGASGNEN